MANRLKVGIIGLGKAGSRFDEKRKSCIWSHCGAYLLKKKFCKVIYGVDPNKINKTLFLNRCKESLVFSSFKKASTLPVDIISIATPMKVRKKIFLEIEKMKNPPKVIICEKPLALDKKARNKILQICKKRTIKLLVNYSRRYNSMYIKLKKIIKKNKIGSIYGITLKVPNRIWSIGSHAFNLLLYLSDKKPKKWKALKNKNFSENNEIAADFICSFNSGFVGRILSQGFKKDLIFEVEILGSTGRIIVNETNNLIKIQKFKKSIHYKDFHELAEPYIIFKKPNSDSPFVNIISKAIYVARKKAFFPNDGEEAKRSEELVEEICQ